MMSGRRITTHGLFTPASSLEPCPHRRDPAAATPIPSVLSLGRGEDRRNPLVRPPRGPREARRG